MLTAERRKGYWFLPLATTALLAWARDGDPFDIAPYARRCRGTEGYKATTMFDYDYARNAPSSFERADDRFVYALQWAEERDIREVCVNFAAPCTVTNVGLEYWSQTWPYPPPRMPTIEDPVDDPWQGKWLQAKCVIESKDRELRFRFEPLAREENPRANNLPGLRYRRTLKIRLVAKESLPGVERVQVFTPSTQETVPVRVEFGVHGSARSYWQGNLEAFNGRVENVRVWKPSFGDRVNGTAFRVGKHRGLIFDVQGTSPAPGGSHDATIVTVRAGDRTFSFAVPDVEKGPLYLPDFDSYVTLASGPSFSPALPRRGERIREKLAREPEQTYERAKREIPPLDPVQRQGGRLYLPLTIDSSWQKFAVEWGGNIFIDKRGVKARGAELKRLEWPGERITWRIGTGATPTYRPATGDSQLSILEDYFPVATATWAAGDIEYREEAFATALEGPLAWQNRDEHSPVVLLVEISARNRSDQPRESHLWLNMNPGETLKFKANELLTEDGELLRARLNHAGKAAVSLGNLEEGGSRVQGIHFQTRLAAGETDKVILALPFLPRLTAAQRERLATLSYPQERARVIDYWKPLVAQAIRFEVPESRFVSFSKSMLVHMHLSTSKDPKSGLMLVPAASYSYPVFANESCFQVLTLDALGDHDTAREYLETFVQLQGSRPFRGTYTGDQRAVYHGAKVAPDYDYTAHEYNLDHGTVIWTMAEHYFTTRDRQWLQHATPGLLRGADWVTEQRQQTMVTDGGEPVREYGLLPAGHLEDNQDWGHWFAVNAYASAGMSRLGEALTDIGYPDAPRICRDAAAYRSDLRRAVIRAIQEAPVTRLRDNTYIPYVPVRPHQRQRLFGPLRIAYYNERYPNPALPTYRLSATREVLYGPLILLNLGIFGVQEPLTGWLLDDWEDNLTMSSSLGLNVHGWVDDEYWFSRGGMVFQANLQNPVLTYLRRREIPAAIRNLYNDFVSCHYPEVNAFTEEYRQWRSPSGPFFKTPDEARFVARLRDVLVREEGADLWLTAGTPRRWLAPGKQIRFREMPTTFGSVSLELAATETAIHGKVSLPSRNKFANAWLVLRVPEQKRIGRVSVDGKRWKAVDLKTGTVKLPPKVGMPMQLKIMLVSSM